MPSIKEVEDIIKLTPIEQPILLKGPHGVGKSECLKNMFESNGYRMITLFVGQMADAGDMIGLPDKTPITVKFMKDGKEFEEQTTITNFAPPKWWPFNYDEKCCIFFDEVNRGKPEVNQCLMDMVLNKRLNGRELPKHTRIIGAMNPPTDGYYQVEELDPAFMDRWNIYDFVPTTEEWIIWASRANVNKTVISFIAKNDSFLDPPQIDGEKAEAKSDGIYPSRRSWERVSKFMNKNGNIRDSLFTTWLMGVIGTGATSSFMSFIKSSERGLNPGTILTGWTDIVSKKVQDFNIGEVIYTNSSLARWLSAEVDTLRVSGDTLKIVVKNLKSYLDVIQVDAVAHFWTEVSEAQRNGEKWPGFLFDADPEDSLSEKYVEVLTGEKDEEVDWE